MIKLESELCKVENFLQILFFKMDYMNDVIKQLYVKSHHTEVELISEFYKFSLFVHIRQEKAKQ